MSTDFKITNEIEYLHRKYNPEHDMFHDPIQMNHIDEKLLSLIEMLYERIAGLEHEIELINCTLRGPIDD